MKKIVLLTMIVSFVFSYIMPPSVSTAFNDNILDRKEIIIKYRNESELKDDKAKNSLKKKHNIQKLERIKIINASNSMLEIVATGESDNVKEIAEKLSKEPGVEYAVPNHKIVLNKSRLIAPNDPNFQLQWGLKNNGQIINGQKGKRGIDINITPAWTLSKGVPEVVVGILDTGIDIRHEDLKESIFVNENEIPGNLIDDDNNGLIDDINGWDFANSDSTPYDSPYGDAHGTHLAGIISAQHNGIGVCGIAPNVKIMPLKFIGEDGSGNVSDVIEAIEYGKTMGIKIFNCSWAMFDYNQALEEEIKNTDAVFVCAAGNYGTSIDTSPMYPACFSLQNIITVGAIDNLGNLASFSNYGQEVDVVAPGVSILSTIPDNQYMFADGTSMAAPFVSGIAALVKSKNLGMPVDELVPKMKRSLTELAPLKRTVSNCVPIDAYNCLK